jgi:hypothetical protein
MEQRIRTSYACLFLFWWLFTIECPGWLVPFPHANQHASDAPPLIGIEEEVCEVAWLCDPDRGIRECNTETDDGIVPRPVAKRMKSTNKVPHADLARGDRKEKKTLAVAKFQNF